MILFCPIYLFLCSKALCSLPTWCCSPSKSGSLPTQTLGSRRPSRSLNWNNSSDTRSPFLSLLVSGREHCLQRLYISLCKKHKSTMQCLFQNGFKGPPPEYSGISCGVSDPYLGAWEEGFWHLASVSLRQSPVATLVRCLPAHSDSDYLLKRIMAATLHHSSTDTSGVLERVFLFCFALKWSETCVPRRGRKTLREPQWYGALQCHVLLAF